MNGTAQKPAANALPPQFTLRQALLEVTAPDRTDDMKAASAQVLADWQRRGDPVDGLRKALAFIGVR